MATVRQISPDAVPAAGRHVLVRVGDKDALERAGKNFVYTINRDLPHNEFESRAQRIISDAELLADQEKIEVVLVCFDPQARD
jgi:hypothetical protein